ncbi:Ubiquinol-cytochrome c reductase complex 6.7 kDa protein [Dendrobium catenatum]|uniref:Ubiquinol-cytochrome c reductase complex 6.7 kDa protein n=1 Tax=Dendrobium catenatum TaxID=906689 RepID=A0A2I0X0V9_9ASPA|nr:Ubiquinol-cytochrome c reductase complex 6.7 kDa protein [Dendrobium catenatum]
MATGSVASRSGLFKFLRPGLRLQSTDVSAAVTWGVAATTTALWLVQVNNDRSTSDYTLSFHISIPLHTNRHFSSVFVYPSH